MQVIAPAIIFPLIIQLFITQCCGLPNLLKIIIQQIHASNILLASIEKIYVHKNNKMQYNQPSNIIILPYFRISYHIYNKTCKNMRYGIFLCVSNIYIIINLCLEKVVNF